MVTLPTRTEDGRLISIQGKTLAPEINKVEVCPSNAFKGGKVIPLAALYTDEARPAGKKIYDDDIP